MSEPKYIQLSNECFLGIYDDTCDIEAEGTSFAEMDEKKVMEVVSGLITWLNRRQGVI